MAINKLVKSPQELRRLEALHQQYSHASGQDGGPAVGQRHDGLGVETMPSQSSKMARRASKARQNPVARRSVQLSERRAQPEQPIKPMALEEIAQHAASLQTPKYNPKGDITRAARHILRREDSELPDTPEGQKLQLLAFHLALHCLSPHVDRRARTALLTPVGPFTRDFHAIAERLDAYPDDAEGQEQLANAILEIQGGEGRGRDPGEKRKADAERLRQRQRGGEDQVLEQLAEWLNIKELEAQGDREEQYEKVLNRFSDFANGSAGQRALRGLNTEGVAQKTQDPVKFRQSYTELAEQAQQATEQTPVQAMLVLIKNHTAPQLPGVIAATLQATSDDMNADNPSNDATRLGVTVTKLSELKVGNTMVPRFELASKRVNDFQAKRGASSAAAA